MLQKAAQLGSWQAYKCTACGTLLEMLHDIPLALCCQLIVTKQLTFDQHIKRQMCIEATAKAARNMLSEAVQAMHVSKAQQLGTILERNICNTLVEKGQNRSQGP